MWRTPLTVSNVYIGATGHLTNHIAGTSCGLDLANGASLGITNSGGMVLRFETDPIDKGSVCWGLRMGGNNVAALAALTNSGKISISTNGLADRYAQNVGVYYDAKTDKTYLGIPGLPVGTVFMIQ